MKENNIYLFELRTILHYGLENTIVARLSIQIIDILNNCNIDQDKRIEVEKIYVESLMPFLLDMSEKYSWFFNNFAEQMEIYVRNKKNGNTNQLPHIPLLENKCHEFVECSYTFVRNLLSLFNLLYGTNFNEPSDFYSSKPNKKSLLQFSEETFGINNFKTKFFKGEEKNLRSIISKRNALENPGGDFGVLKISNFTKNEPCWWRIDGNGNEIDKVSIREGFKGALDDLLILAENIFIFWAIDNLRLERLMKIVYLEEGARDPKLPLKYKIRYMINDDVEPGEIIIGRNGK